MSAAPVPFSIARSSCLYLPNFHIPARYGRASMGVVDDRFEKNLMMTSLDVEFNWARRSSLWWLRFGLACAGSG